MIKLYLNYQNLTKYIFIATLFIVNFTFSQEPYLHGLPQAPPYQEVEVKIAIFKEDECGIAKENLVGYIIKVEEGTFSDYNVLLQDEKGVEHKCYIETNLTSNYDLNLLKYTLFPGNKVNMKVQYCGSGGFIYIMSIKNLKRNN